nr:HAD family hydrolase [Pseudenhygromyxa sp. WMMC2535]
MLVDLDGTLVDRDAGLRKWLRHRAGLEREAIAELLALDRRSGQDLAALAVELHLARPGLAASPAALADRVRAELPRELRPDPAVDRALLRLRRAGVRLCLVSNGSGETQRAKLAAAGVDPRSFSAVLISGELGVAKPDPEIFRRALSSLGLGPEQALMIGDAITHDIAGARQVGVDGLWITGGGAEPVPSLSPPFSPPPSPPPLSAPDFPSAVARLFDEGRLAGAPQPRTGVGARVRGLLGRRGSKA